MKIKHGFSGERYLVVPESVAEIMRKDRVLSTLHITDIGYYPRAAHHFCERVEPIRQHVLIYCVAGRGFYSVRGKRWMIEAGQYFVLPPGETHVYGADPGDPWTIYWIHFEGTLAAHYIDGDICPHTIDTVATSRIRNRHDMFEEIFSVLDSALTIDNLRYAGALFHHYLGSLRYIEQYRMTGRGKTPDDIAGRITHFLSENIERHLTLKEIASSCGLSESRMSAVFRERTGHSVLNYFNLLKIKRACDFLDNTYLKINQICFKAGISDPYYFSRLFTKIMGMSPERFRNRQRT